MDDRQLIADLLSALEYHTEQTRPIEFSKVAIQAAREYLQKPEQPAQQEPVYFCDYGYEGWGKVDAAMAAENRACGMTVEAYYTSPPPQRKPLTDEQINAFFQGMEPNNGFWLSFARAIEAAHGIKENT